MKSIVIISAVLKKQKLSPKLRMKNYWKNWFSNHPITKNMANNDPKFLVFTISIIIFTLLLILLYVLAVKERKRLLREQELTQQRNPSLQNEEPQNDNLNAV